jgi:cysteinyl-tRNA synthetase
MRMLGLDLDRVGWKAGASRQRSNLLVDERQLARRMKKTGIRSDVLRDRIQEKGYTVQDSALRE